MTKPGLLGLFGKRTGALAAKGPIHLAKREYLRTIDIFQDLNPDQMAGIDRQTDMRTCPRGRLLYSQDDRAEALFLLKQGKIQLYRLTPSGKRLELASIEPGAFFGEMPLLGESLRHTYAEASEDSILCVMSRADVERLVRERPEVGLRMLEALGRRLASNEARLEEMAYRSVPARIAAVLTRLGDGQNDRVIPMTHQELGDIVGALRETVTKVLDEFRDEGLVELGRGRITIRDVAALRGRLDED